MDNINTWTELPVEESIRMTEDKRTEINGDSTSIVWPTLGSRTAKEQNRYIEERLNKLNFNYVRNEAPEGRFTWCIQGFERFWEYQLPKDLHWSYINLNFRLYYGNSFFSQRIINEWNELDSNVLECSSVLNFTFKIDKIWIFGGLYKSITTLDEFLLFLFKTCALFLVGWCNVVNFVSYRSAHQLPSSHPLSPSIIPSLFCLCFPPPEGCEVLWSACLSVCLSARIPQKPHV